MKELFKKYKGLILNIIGYGMIGVLSAVIDFCVFTILIKFLNIDKFLANIISMHVGMFVSFTLNTFVNFKKSDRLIKRFLSYYSIILCGMGLSTLILWIGSKFISEETIVKLLSMIIVSGLQFIFNKIITYRK